MSLTGSHKPINKYFYLALEKTDIAIKKHSIIPLGTEITKVFQDDFNKFELRKLCSNKPSYLDLYGPKINPFNPWDRVLEIDYITNNHVLILNKYPVQRGHLLLITNHWESQSSWLTRKDWSAISKVNSDTSGLWFFNSCAIAGASQTHKHIQLIPKIDKNNICPRNQWFKQKLITSDYYNCKNISIKQLTLEDWKNSDLLYAKYKKCCEELLIGNKDLDDLPKIAYNIVFTNEWLALVLRSRESYKGFNINGLGFAGYILSTKESDLVWLNKSGPEELLAKVSLYR